MTRHVLIFLLGLLILPGGVRGQDGLEFRVGPVTGLHFGESSVELDFGFGGSELVYPLDLNRAGFEIGFRSLQDGRSHWTADVRLMFALEDPGDKMLDRDWDNTPRGLFEWSRTESTVDGSLTDLEIEVTRVLTAGSRTELVVVLGFGYQKLKQRMVDLTGRQILVTDTALYYYQIDYDGIALTYEIRYLRPQIGLMPRVYLSPGLALELKAVASPLLHAKDIDDHVLRSFQVRTDGRGFGFAGRLGLIYRGTGRLFAKLEGEYARSSVKTSGMREYYNDNEFDGMLAGEGFPVNYTVTSEQYAVRFSLGLSF